MLLTVHVAAAGITKTPELALDPGEAKTLAKALGEVNEAFPTNVDPRMVVVLNATAIAAMIYGPRFIAVRDRIKREREERARGRQPADVISPSGTVAASAADFGIVEVGSFAAQNQQVAEDAFATSQN